MTTKTICDCCGKEMTNEGDLYIDQTYYNKEFCRVCAVTIDDFIIHFIKTYYKKSS